MLFVEHNVRRALEIADYALRHGTGTHRAVRPGRQPLDSPTVASAYFGRLRR